MLGLPFCGLVWFFLHRHGLMTVPNDCPLPPCAAIEWPSLLTHYRQQAQRHAQQPSADGGVYPLDLALIQARLTDHYRDLGLNYPDSDVLQVLLETLDEAAQYRLLLLLAGLDYPPVSQAFQRYAWHQPDHLQQGLLEVALRELDEAAMGQCFLQVIAASALRAVKD